MRVALAVNLLLIALSGCAAQASKAEPAPSPLRLAIPATAPAEVRNASLRGGAIPIRVIGAPDIGARRRVDLIPTEPGYNPDKEPIKVQLLNYWEDGANYQLNVNFKNTGNQILKTIFIFGYDRLGRLVTTQASQTFFRAKTNVVRTFRFSRRGRAVRWSLVVKS